MTWFMDNLGTIIVVLILLVVVALIVRKLIRDKRQGKSSCGCGCEQCGNCTACHKS